MSLLISRCLRYSSSACRSNHYVLGRRFYRRLRFSGSYYAPKYEANKQYLEKEPSQETVDKQELRKCRNELFDNEKKRQIALVSRIEKIEVEVKGPPEDVTLLMNKNLSTPYNCAQHINELLLHRSAVAEIDEKVLWDMHRPLEDNCKLRFIHFRDDNPEDANKAFWRSCSFLLGKVIEEAFKDNIDVFLHSWPKPDIRSGSFVYDMILGLSSWAPTDYELRTFTSMLWKLKEKKLNFERLSVNAELAKQIFEHNQFKQQQIDDISAKSPNLSVTLYRIEDHIDISYGPMISNTSQIGTFQVASVHPIQTKLGLMYRFQGVAIPQQLYLNSYTFSVLKERARKLNTSGLSLHKHFEKPQLGDFQKQEEESPLKEKNEEKSKVALP